MILSTAIRISPVRNTFKYIAIIGLVSFQTRQVQCLSDKRSGSSDDNDFFGKLFNKEKNSHDSSDFFRKLEAIKASSNPLEELGKTAHELLNSGLPTQVFGIDMFPKLFIRLLIGSIAI